MKKFCISLGLIFIIVLTIVLGGQDSHSINQEYLRIHIRANSNSSIDQAIKYQVKDTVVEFLTPIVASCNNKTEIQDKINGAKQSLQLIIDSFLLQNGFDYKSKMSINNEQFPTRCYDDVTLLAGYYDAVIIELGSGQGDNWWCVVYPPLCFTDSQDIQYKSKILQLINNF